MSLSSGNGALTAAGGTRGPFNPVYQDASSYSMLNFQPQSVAGGFSASEATEKLNDHLTSLASFFGHPNKRLDINPHDLYDVEHEHLPDAYRGRNSTLTRIMIDSLVKADMYMVGII